MHEARPTDQEIAQAIIKLFPEFLKRYGTAVNCTRPQFDRTISDLAIKPDLEPYLGAVFLMEDQFQGFRAESPTVNWEEVEKRAERIFGELQHTTRTDDGFHESWIGPNGIGA